MALRDQEVFNESGPAPGAEARFANDPEMLAKIRLARERERIEGPPRRRPIWWQIFMTGLGLLFAALATIPVALEVMAFHPVVPAGGLVSGMCLALGILGEYPKRYRITDDRTGEQEKATLWKNLSLPLRLGAFALVLVAPALAYGLMFLL